MVAIQTRTSCVTMCYKMIDISQIKIKAKAIIIYSIKICIWENYAVLNCKIDNFYLIWKSFVPAIVTSEPIQSHFKVTWSIGFADYLFWLEQFCFTRSADDSWAIQTIFVDFVLLVVIICCFFLYIYFIIELNFWFI